MITGTWGLEAVDSHPLPQQVVLSQHGGIALVGYVKARTITLQKDSTFTMRTILLWADGGEWQMVDAGRYVVARDTLRMLYGAQQDTGVRTDNRLRVMVAGKAFDYRRN
jgi:hypothetical protein